MVAKDSDRQRPDRLASTTFLTAHPVATNGRWGRILAGMARSKLTRTTCKGCKTQGHAHEGSLPKTVTFVVTKRGKVPLGMRMQATGAAMSPGLSGASKGGYAMQAANNRKADKGKLVCVVCGGDKIAMETVKVKTDEAVRLLSQ